MFLVTLERTFLFKFTVKNKTIYMKIYFDSIKQKISSLDSNKI